MSTEPDPHSGCSAMEETHPQAIEALTPKESQEEKRFRVSTRRVKAQYKRKLKQLIEILLQNGIVKVKAILLSQSIRANISPNDQDQLCSADYKEVIEICIRSFRWYSNIFVKEIPRHFEQETSQQVKTLLKKIEETVHTYFKTPGRVLTQANKLTIVTDSEYGTLTDSQREELHLTVLDAIGKLPHTDLEICDRDVLAILRENTMVQRELKTGVLVTLRKGYMTGPNTLQSPCSYSGFKPKHPTSPLCWLLTQSQQWQLYLKAPTATAQLDGKGDHQEIGTESASRDETEEEQNESGELVTINKGYRMCRSTMGSLGDRSRHFPPVFLEPPPS